MPSFLSFAHSLAFNLPLTLSGLTNVCAATMDCRID